MANELVSSLAGLKATTQALLAALNDPASTPLLIGQSLNGIAAAQQKYIAALQTVPLGKMLDAEVMDQVDADPGKT
jgi:hypothetical protein